MAQQNIDFGTFPDDPNADAIRTAFRKTQDNFDQLFATAEQQAVLSVNRTPGAGITVNSPTGNVVVSANIACVQVATSTLSIGISANGANSAVLTSTNQVLVVDLPNTISNVANITLVNNVTANYMLANIGTTTSNLTVNANTSTNNLTVLNNINSNTISVYDASVSNLTTLSGYIQPLGNFISTLRPNTSSIDVGTITSYFGNGYFDNVYVNNNFVSSNVTGNSMTAGNISVTNNANITANLRANNVSVNNNTITNNLTVNLAFTGNTANIVNISANTFTLNANPIMAVGVITPVYNTVYLGSNVVVSGTTSANATNVLSITVPSQGVYEFTTQLIVLPGTGASQPISFGLYYANGTIVPNSEVMGATSDASNQKTTITGTTIATTNSSETFTVKAWGTGLSPGVLTYGGNGQSSLKYVRLDAVATITTNASVTFGNIQATSNVNVTNNLTVGGSIIGNVSGNFSGTISNGTSNLQIPIVNGNINLSASGSPNVFVVTGTGTNVTGTMQSTGNINTNQNLGVSGNAVIGGNLTVDGNIVYVNVETLDVEDPIINLQRGPNGASPSSNSGKDVGTALNYFDSSPQIAWMGWDTSNAEISFASQVNIASEVVSYTQLANIRSGNANLGNTVFANFANVASNTITNNLTVNNALSGNTANFSGNVIVPNLTVNNALSGNTANFSGNVIVPNLTVNNALSGNTANFSGNLIVSGNANIINNLSVSGAIFGNISGNFTGTISNGTSNINIPVVNGNVNIVSGGVTSLVAKSTGANVFGTLDTSGNITGLNLGTSGNVIATGNIQGSNIESGNILVNSMTSGQIAIASTGGKLVGGPDLVWSFGNADLYSTGFVSNRYVTANGNITGGNLITGGSLSVTGNANLGNIGTNTAIITTGNITTINSGLLQNGTSNITLDLSGNVSTYIGGNVTAQFVVTGSGANIAGTANVIGNANVGNLGSTDGVFTGNISANNLSTTNQITAGNGLQVTTGTVSILAGNLDITGNINATGNLNYSNVNDLVVGDPLIYIGANNTGDTYDLGLVGSYNEGTYYHTGIARNAATNYWTFFDGVVAEPTTVIDWANAVYPTVKLGNLIATGNANITGYANIVGNANIGNIGTTFVIATSNITGANIYANSGTVGANNLTGTLTTNSQPNVTSLGVLTGLDINGTVTAGNLTANTGVITGNGSSISALNASNISTGTLDQARLANSSLTVNGVAISLGGSGTVTASTTNALTFDNAGTGASSGSTFDGSTARTISYNTIGAPSTTGTNASGSWGISVTGSANTVTNAAQANITSVGTLTSLAVTGNVTAGNVYANSGTIGASTLTGTLSTAAQPNITSLGSLTGLTVSNASGVVNFTTTANVTLGAVANLHISGGSSGQYLQTNGSGTLTWASVPAGYGDSNVVTLLSSFGSNTISTTGNISGGNIAGILRPTSGSGTAGVIFPADPGGGSGDVASIKWYAYSGEACYLELNVQNDSDDRIRLVASGGVQMNTGGLGVGTTPSGTDGEIRATNNITAYYSDDRLKKRLGVIENALDKVNSLTGFFYEANETAQELGYKVKREVGLSAQEVEKVLPEVVAPAPIDDKYKTLHYERIIPLLVEAIKEITIELNDIKKRL